MDTIEGTSHMKQQIMYIAVCAFEKSYSTSIHLYVKLIYIKNDDIPKYEKHQHK